MGTDIPRFDRDASADEIAAALLAHGVVIVEPAEYGARDRHLLHVAITRAADQLWVFATRGRGLLGIRPRAPAQPSR